jgi:PAS domain S-box-containing protein
MVGGLASAPEGLHIPKGPVTENLLQSKLGELRRQFTALQQFSREDPGSSRELLPGVLVGLQRSMEELQAIVTELEIGTPGVTSLESVRGTVGTAVEMTARKQAEDRLTLQYAVARVHEASLDAVITIDHQGQVVEFNSAAENIFGYRREQAVGRALSELIVPPRIRAQALAGFARYRTTGASVSLGKRFEAFAMKADGSEFPVEVALAPIGVGDPPLFTIYVCDATARKNGEQEVRLYRERLRSLMTDLLLAEEHERRRLAVDLHDGLSQTIALTQIKLSALRLSMDGKLERSFDEIEELIDQTNRAAREISFELVSTKGEARRR